MGFNAGIVDMSSFNVSATLNIFRVLAKPSLCLPQATVASFAELPIPLDQAFAKYRSQGNDVNIKAVILDKDDCFAVPHENDVHKPYRDHFAKLRSHYPGSRLLIVSNTAGASAVDPSLSLAETLSKNTGIHVLAHRTKKPGCGPEILDYLRSQEETKNIKPEEIAVVGDRLMTDMLLANMMGGYGVWIKDGVVPYEKKSIFTKMERSFAEYLMRRGYEAPIPRSPFE